MHVKSGPPASNPTQLINPDPNLNPILGPLSAHTNPNPKLIKKSVAVM